MALNVLKGASVLETEQTRKAQAWLERVTPNNTVSAATALLLKTRLSDAGLRFLERSQNSDGGWGPYADSPSEPFDTALVLLALSERNDFRHLIAGGRKFLISQQNADGSWPATTRPPRGESYAQMMSTTGWATLALLATRAGR
jgi:squalene cyclase